MRTIGKRNITMVKGLVKKLAPQYTTWSGVDKYELGEAVINQLPVSLWDTWESADSEIRRIVHDTCWSLDR